MGVSECSRRGCGNILCARYSSKYGYICFECFDELVALGPISDIGTFLDTHKPSRAKIIASKSYFDVIFPTVT